MPKPPSWPLALPLALLAGGLVLARILEFFLIPPVATIAAGLAALLISRRKGLPRWWNPILLFAPVTAYLLQQMHLPAWVWPSAAVLLAGVFWGAVTTRVPLYLSNRAEIDALADLLPADRPFRLIDLGCGDARVLLALAERFPLSRFDGVERAPLPFLVAWLRARPTHNVFIQWGNFWKTALAPYDAIYAFLSPAPMPRLWDKVQAEAQTDALFISNRFDIPGHPADRHEKTEQVDLHLWIIRPSVTKTASHHAH